MLDVKELVKKYGEKTAVNGLNFHIDSGEIVGLLGLNGAGKSTTMNCITGYIAPTSGTVLVDGSDILKEPDRARRMIGYLPEVFSFYPDMKVYEYLDFVCDLKGFTRKKKDRREHIEKICRQTGIHELTGRMIRNLSKGYKQRVGFAQALIGNPKILVLDEPTVGLDPSQIIEIRQLIRRSGQESTVIVSSHILSEIQAICSRIIVIHNGGVVADGPTDRLVAETADQNEITIRVKAGAAQAEEVIRGLSFLHSFKFLPEMEKGTQDILLTADAGIDIREEVFRAFADKGMVLLKMSGREASLENTFLHLTGQEPGGPAVSDQKGADR